MFLFSLILASPLLLQEPGFDIPITHTGEAATEAFLHWVEGLPAEMEYPSQMSMTMNMGMEVAEGLDEGFQMQLHMNSLSDSPGSLRTWGELAVQVNVGLQIDWKLDFQIGVDANGLRILMNDQGYLEKEFDWILPKGVYLSADRLAKISGLYLDLMESASPMYGDEMIQTFRTIEGPGALMHSSLWSRYVTKTKGWQIDGWGQKGGKALIELGLDPEYMHEIMNMQDVEIDPSFFEDLSTVMVVSLATGEFLHWKMEMEIPLPQELSEVDGKMSIMMEMQTVPVSKDAPPVLLPAEGTVDLNPHFDTYLPMMESILQMAAAQAKSAQGEKDSSDDFEF